MPMPLVHQGVMFLQTFPDTVLALDATNGQVLWRHQYKPKGALEPEDGARAPRATRCFVPTSDLHVLALNAKTGELVWDHEIASADGDAGRQGLPHGVSTDGAHRSWSATRSSRA